MYRLALDIQPEMPFYLVFKCLSVQSHRMKLKQAGIRQKEGLQVESGTTCHGQLACGAIKVTLVIQPM